MKTTSVTYYQGIIFCCSEQNDLYRANMKSGRRVPRFDSAEDAIKAAPPGGGVLLLANDYPVSPTPFSPELLGIAKNRNVKIYIEFPSWLPNQESGDIQNIHRERGVIMPPGMGPDLPEFRILLLNDCHYIPASVNNPLVTIAHVAGYDRAVYGVPEKAAPILFEMPEENLLVSTTCLSCFIKSRYGPEAQISALWKWIFSRLDPNGAVPDLKWKPVVYPAWERDDTLPKDAERLAFENAVNWYRNSGLLVSRDRAEEIHRLLSESRQHLPAPADSEPVGDGSSGFLEGYASEINWDGNQNRNLPLRADCNSEVAMGFALDARINNNSQSELIAKNLQNYIYFYSGLCKGGRGNPKHPAYGHIAWGDAHPAWVIANYGDDNARVLLGTILSAAVLETSDWNEAILRGIRANFRTTGKLGFRGDRIDMQPLEQNGWKHYANAETVSLSPHFESYLWACYLWAYDKTGYEPFLTQSKIGIRIMMEGYPDKWRWKDNIERARMLLCLSWLVRLENTTEHREWLMRMAKDLLELQTESGAIPEWLEGSGGGHYIIPQSNEQYGTGETPLIQENSDPACDTLYTLGFGFLGLHEAASATGDPDLKKAEDRLAEFLCRIQTRSEALPYLSGAWMRAFDFDKWEYWASPADVGWGPWSIESGWGNAWITAVMGLRIRGESFWDATAKSNIQSKWESVEMQMEQNDGSPWSGEAASK
ncbi:hypothetical protein JW926_17395 [Candidatus Sumerlaeota bacterium]|nr:hypothetical protein [Candidatus Sumerlaeota bacterium]